jgi:hypothetical protein
MSPLRRAAAAVFLTFFAFTGCVGPRPIPSHPARSSPDVVRPQSLTMVTDSAPQDVASPGTTVATTPVVQPPSATQPIQTSPSQDSAAAGEALPASAASPANIKAASRAPAKAKTLGTNPPPRTSASPGNQAAIAPGKQPPALATSEKPPIAPALDLASLEQRLRDTHAIGLFTKLSLKNQVDDLLKELQAFHRGQTKGPLTELRQRYDLLLLKVLTLLQDGDPQLASAISASREALWNVLADPEKFAKLQVG